MKKYTNKLLVIIVIAVILCIIVEAPYMTDARKKVEAAFKSKMLDGKE